MSVSETSTKLEAAIKEVVDNRAALAEAEKTVTAAKNKVSESVNVANKLRTDLEDELNKLIPRPSSNNVNVRTASPG